MARGRKPKPDSEKQRIGTARKDRQKPPAPPELYQTALEFCQVHAWVVRAARAELERGGLFVKGKPHPALHLIKDHSSQFRGYCTMFGFSQKQLREELARIDDEDFFGI